MKMIIIIINLEKKITDLEFENSLLSQKNNNKLYHGKKQETTSETG